jgi:3-dehydroquinate synthetase
MTVAARLASNLGVIDAAQGDELLQRQTQLFARAGLPTTVPASADFERLWHAMTLDKKSRGNKVNFVLPTSLGEVRRVEDISPEDVRAALTSTR